MNFADWAQNSVQNAVLAVAMRLTRMRLWRQIERAAQHPEKVQAAKLTEILRQNSASRFGTEHGFSNITNIEDFRSAVEVQTYESLRPYIDDQDNTGRPALTVDAPVMYTRTSGTTGQPKDIPVTATGIAKLSATQRAFATSLYRESTMFSGKLLGIGSAAIEGFRPSGKPYGSATGLIYENMPAVVRRKYVLPAAVFDIAEYDSRFYVIAAMSLATQNLTGIVTANPSTLVRLRNGIVDNWDQLISDISSGRLSVDTGLTGKRAEIVKKWFKPRPKRATVLRTLGDPTELGFSKLWPQLTGISCWTGGSCGFALAALRPWLADTTKILEAGYSSSEFRGSIGVDLQANLCMPTIWDHVFEFVEQSDWEQGRHKFLDVSELLQGQRYYIFVTTTDGLYRYDMNDIVEVNGRFGKTPCIAFVQKGKGVTNITGEKLYEDQILEALSTATAYPVEFFVVLADEQASTYQLYVEGPSSPTTTLQLEAAMDEQLQTINLEYRSKRSSGRLAPLTAVALRPGTGNRYRRYCVDSGQRDAQFKHLVLRYASDCDFDFNAHQLFYD